MSPLDIFNLNQTNLDPLTENYDLGFYLNYMMRWPSLFSGVTDRRDGIVGYSTYYSLTYTVYIHIYTLLYMCEVYNVNKSVMGKLEEQHPSMRHSEHYTPWHGHITVLTVAPAWRRLGHARRLTERLESGSDINDAWFVDLYVRAGNKIAVDMYKGMGYVSSSSHLSIYLLDRMLAGTCLYARYD